MDLANFFFTITALFASLIAKHEWMANLGRMDEEWQTGMQAGQSVGQAFMQGKFSIRLYPIQCGAYPV